MTSEASPGSPPSPDVLPVFPLTGVLLLPGNFLPLNVFEPRYRRLVEDTLAGDRQIGMVQPRVPMQDNQPILGPVDVEAPPLYPVGCVGLIDRCEPQDDGRYLIVLRGLRRFRQERELALKRGYRVVRAAYEEFAADGPPQENFDTGELLAAVDRFSEDHGLSFDRELLAALPGESLVNGLAAALPFLPGEKQALLEAPTGAVRLELLLALMGMGLDPAAGEARYAPPVVH